MGFHRFSLAFVVMIMIILLKPNCGRDALLVKSNTTYQCDGLLNGCGIVEDLELELEFFMGSNVIRILADGQGTVTGNTGNAGETSQKGCEGKSYAECIAESQGGPKPENPGIYNKCKP